MNKKICLLVCQYYLAEVKEAVKLNGFDDVDVRIFDANCLSAPRAKTGFGKYPNSDNGTPYDSIHLLHCCYLEKEKSNSEIDPNYNSSHLEQCLNFLMSEKTLNSLQAERNYLVSSGWLKNWKNWFRTSGFTKEVAKEYFKEFADRIVWLNTDIDPLAEQNLIEFSSAVGLDYVRKDIGMEYAKLFIAKIVYKMKYEIAEKHSRDLENQRGNHSVEAEMALDLIGGLTLVEDEETVINKILEVCYMLFAPKQVAFAKFKEGKISQIYNSAFTADSNIDVSKFKTNFKGDYCNTEKGEGFLLRMGHSFDPAGFILVDQIAFPDYKIKYLNLALSIVKVFFIALSNAQKYTEIIETREELKKLNKSKDKFFSIIAHDLRSPFHPMLGLSSILATQADKMPREKIIRFANELHRSIERQYELLERLLDWSRAQSGKMPFVPLRLDMRDKVDIAFELLSNKASVKEIELVNSIPFNVFANADPNMIESVLQNLISNAIKFTYNKGKIEVFMIEKNDHYEFTVKDSGVGISAENMKKLFQIEVHVTNKGTNNEVGSGLGLHLCKELIEIHRGIIRVYSKVGEGTSFVFTLPKFG